MMSSPRKPSPLRVDLGGDTLQVLGDQRHEPFVERVAVSMEHHVVRVAVQLLEGQPLAFLWWISWMASLRTFHVFSAYCGRGRKRERGANGQR